MRSPIRYSFSLKGPVPLGSSAQFRPPLSTFSPVHDVPGWVGELREEVGLGSVDGEPQSVVVDHLQAGELGGNAVDDVLGAHDVAQVGVGDRGCGAGIEGPLDGPLEVVRRHGLAVVELRVGAQVEGVHQPVGAHLPPLGYVGDQLQVGVDGHEAAEELHDESGGRGVAGEVRIEGRRVRPDAAEEPSRRGLGHRLRLGHGHLRLVHGHLRLDRHVGLGRDRLRLGVRHGRVRLGRGLVHRGALGLWGLSSGRVAIVAASAGQCGYCEQHQQYR